MKNIVDPQIKIIVEEIEKTAQDFEYGHQISDKLAPAIDRARQIGNKDAEQKLIWEYQLFRFVTKTEFGKPEKDRRFYPMGSGITEDGRTVNFPEINDFKDDSIEYFKKRVSETQNPVLNARYADFVWEFEKEPSFGKIAVDAYLETAENYYRKTWFFRLQDVFDRCVYLAMLKVVDAEKLQEIKAKLLAYLSRMIQDGHYRFCLELIGAFLEIKVENTTKEEYEKVLTITRQCANHFKAQNDFYLQRSFLARLEKLTSKYGQSDLSKAIREQEAEAYVAEAEFHEANNNFLVAASAYENALKVFQKLGNKKKINLYKKKLSEANKKSVGQFKSISTEIKISNEKIKKFTDIILSAKDSREALQRLSVFDSLLPDYQSTILQTKKMQKQTPLQFLISHKVFNNNGHLISGDGDPFQHVLIRNLMMGIGVGSIFRDIIFERMNKEKKFKADNLINYLKDWGLIDNQNIKLIEHGIKKHFEQDYISSIHILVPQLEAVIRKLLGEGGIQTISFIPGTTNTRETPLTELLKRDEAKVIFGETLWWYLYLVLVSPLGYNLRNEVAHGLIKIEKCNLKNSNLILHLYILLTRFHLAKKEKSKK